MFFIIIIISVFYIFEWTVLKIFIYKRKYTLFSFTNLNTFFFNIKHVENQERGAGKMTNVEI